MYKNTGDYYGFRYRTQVGDDDPLKKRVNRYITSGGKCRYGHRDDLDCIGSWVTQDPQTYCKREWNEIITRLGNNYHTFMDDALLMADLYYAKSTAELAAVYARKLLKLIRTLKRRDVRAIKYYFSKYNSDYGNMREGKRLNHKALEEVPQAWLAMSFVINPLMKTAKSCFEVINNPLIWREVDLYAGRCSFSREGTHGFWGNIRHDSGVLRGTGKGYVRFKNPNEHLIERLGITDIIGTVYDIIPWSWAVDYFFNVSQYLQALNPRYNNFEWSNLHYGISISRKTILEFNQNHYPGRLANSYTGSSYHRFPGPPSGVQLKAEFDLSLDQTANLLSAVALSFKQKFKLVNLG